MAAYPGNATYTPVTVPGAFAHAWVVEPSDTVDLPAPTSAVYVGATGDVTMQLAGVEAGNPTLFASVQAGTTLYVQATRVLDTGTDSTNIVALW